MQVSLEAHVVRSVTRSVVLAMALGLVVVTAPPAEARGGHGFGAGGAHGSEFAGGRRRGNDNYVKAASEEREKLLNTKLKSICRGC
jgi:hypothetical protein